MMNEGKRERRWKEEGREKGRTVVSLLGDEVIVVKGWVG